MTSATITSAIHKINMQIDSFLASPVNIVLCLDYDFVF